MLSDGRTSPFRRFEVVALLLTGALLPAVIAAVQGPGENAFGNMGWVHYHQAVAVLDGQGFGRDWFGQFQPDLFARPTYTLLLCPAVAVIGRNFEPLRIVIAVAQGALLALTALAVASVLVRAGAARAARFAAWGVVLHPLLVSQAATFVDTGLFVAALIGSYAAAAAVPRDARAWRWLVVGLCFGVAVLTRSTALCLAPALVLVMRRNAGTVRRALLAAGLVTVGTLAVLAPWLLRNHALTGRWMLSTVDGVNLWMGNNENTARFLDDDRSLDELPGRPRFDSSRQPTVEAQIESYEAGRAAAAEFVRAHPGLAARLAVRKAGDFWSLTPKPRSTRSRLNDVKDAVGLAWTVPLFAFAAIGLFAGLRAGGALRGFATDVALTSAIFTLPHAMAWGGTRLRAPLEPLLVGLAAVGLVFVIDRVRRRPGG